MNNTLIIVPDITENLMILRVPETLSEYYDSINHDFGDLKFIFKWFKHSKIKFIEYFT